MLGIEIKLSNNHTLNGKPFQDICDKLAGKYPKSFKFVGWHPNCRCYAIPIIDKENFFEELDNPNYQKPNEITDTPQNFKLWVSANRDRLEKSKSLPYFVRDNEKFFPQMTITQKAMAGVREEQKFNAEMEQIYSNTKFPPRIDSYEQVSKNVFISNLHQESEREENIRLATFLAEKTNEPVFILPHIQPSLKNSIELRKEYMPNGVKENKNPDFYFRGRFVDGKSMTKIKFSENEENNKEKIQNRIKDAFKQADDAFVEIPLLIDRNTIYSSVNGQLKSSKNKHIVYIKYGDDFYTIKKPDK